jgi:hypothetical protein
VTCGELGPGDKEVVGGRFRSRRGGVLALVGTEEGMFSATLMLDLVEIGNAIIHTRLVPVLVVFWVESQINEGKRG